MRVDHRSAWSPRFLILHSTLIALLGSAGCSSYKPVTVIITSDTTWAVTYDFTKVRTGSGNAEFDIESADHTCVELRKTAAAGNIKVRLDPGNERETDAPFAKLIVCGGHVF